MREALPQLSLTFHPAKRACLRFDGPDLSSDAGLLLLRATDDHLGLCRQIAVRFPDERNGDDVRHARLEQVRQRLFQILQGYEDTRDAKHLRHDPLLKFVCDLLPQDAQSLSSQPTLCRFENAADEETIASLSDLLMDSFVNDLPKNTRHLTLDLDGSFFEAHGLQQGTLFNAYYRARGYLPLFIFDAPGRLAAALLRQGNVPDSRDALGLLTRLIAKLRERFPTIYLLIRGDSAFSMPELLTGLEDLSTPASRIDFLFAIRSNARLSRETKVRRDAMQRWHTKPGRAKRRYQSFEYAAASWPHKRRIIARIEVKQGEVQTRYLVTSLRHRSKPKVFKGYGQRGQAENWIKSLKYGTKPRLSCERFVTNHLRLLLHGFAYTLLWKLREVLGLVDRGQRTIEPQTLRERLLKVACRVRQSVRRVLIELPRAFAGAAAFRGVLAHFQALTAQT